MRPLRFLNMSKRTRIQLLVIGLVIAVVVTTVVAMHQYARQVLLSDVRKAKGIIVSWRLPGDRTVAFELDEPTRETFVHELTENLGVDFSRGIANVTPSIGIYLTDDKHEYLASYGIRYAQGHGRCPTMESLRDTASKSRPLSELDVDAIFNDEDLWKKRKNVFPEHWPSFDYVLPITPSDEDPLRKEFRSTPPDRRLRETLEGHAKNVESVAFSPDGKLLASGSLDGTIKLWDTARGESVATLTGDMTFVTSLAFCPDGKSLVSAGDDDGTIHLWDVTTGKKLTTFKGHTKSVISVAISPNGKTLASGGWDNTIKLWDLASGKNITTLSGNTASVCSVVFSPDGQTLASDGGGDTIRLWDVGSGKNTSNFSSGSPCVSSIAFSPDGTTLAAASWGGGRYRAKMWNVASGEEIATLKFSSSYACGPVFIAFSPDGKTLASGGLGCKIKLWDATAGNCVAIFGWQSASVSCLAFSPDGRFIASGSREDYDKTVKLWDVRMGDEVSK